MSGDGLGEMAGSNRAAVDRTSAVGGFQVATQGAC